MSPDRFELYLAWWRMCTSRRLVTVDLVDGLVLSHFLDQS